MRAGADCDEPIASMNSMMLFTEATLMEFDGRITTTAQTNATRNKFNVKGLRKPDGTPWDFSRRSHRKMAMETLDTQWPDVVVGLNIARGTNTRISKTKS